VQIDESLRPFPQIFPFWEDYRRKQVLSGLPPDHGTRFRASGTIVRPIRSTYLFLARSQCEMRNVRSKRLAKRSPPSSADVRLSIGPEVLERRRLLESFR
jgi:hypothetical protein